MLNFPDKPNWQYDHQKIDKITVYPEVEFEISVFTEPDTFPRWKEYVIGCYLFGCTCGISLKTPDEVGAYIKRQMNNAPKYAELKAKREAIANRIKPLQRKWEQNSDDLFKLAEHFRPK